MTKVHLRRNKLTETNRPLAVCASQSSGNGDCRTNGRSTYRFMASEIVGLPEFLATPATARCTHCCDAGLLFLNRQRRDKGRSEFANWTEVESYFAGK